MGLHTLIPLTTPLTTVFPAIHTTYYFYEDL
jgi:hypothetical protein